MHTNINKHPQAKMDKCVDKCGRDKMRSWKAVVLNESEICEGAKLKKFCSYVSPMFPHCPGAELKFFPVEDKARSPTFAFWDVPKLSGNHTTTVRTGLTALLFVHHWRGGKVV